MTNKADTELVALARAGDKDAFGFTSHSDEPSKDWRDAPITVVDPLGREESSAD